MSEFVNREFEVRESYEIDGYVERADKVLPPPSDTDNARALIWTTFDTDPSKRLNLQLGMGTIADQQRTWLCASERFENPTGDYEIVTRYVVHIEQRIFIVQTQRIDLAEAPSKSPQSNDLIKMEFSLGMYVPAPNDWDRLSWIIDQAQEFNLRKKGAEIAQMGKSVQNLLDNTEELS